MTSLYELTGQYLELEQMLDNPDVEQDVLADLLATVNDEIEIKADNYAKIIRNLEGSVAAIKAEQDRLAKKKASIEAGIKRLKNNLQESMIATGKRTFKTDLFSFNIQKNGGAAPIILDVDVSFLPDKLVRITEEPDMKAITEYIKETGDLSYAHFGERGESLRIK